MDLPSFYKSLYKNIGIYIKDKNEALVYFVNESLCQLPFCKPAKLVKFVMLTIGFFSLAI